MLTGHRPAMRRRTRRSRAARIAVPLAIPVALGLTLGIVIAVSSSSHSTPIKVAEMPCRDSPSGSLVQPTLYSCVHRCRTSGEKTGMKGGSASARRVSGRYMKHTPRCCASQQQAATGTPPVRVKPFTPRATGTFRDPRSATRLWITRRREVVPAGYACACPLLDLAFGQRSTGLPATR